MLNTTVFTTTASNTTRIQHKHNSDGGFPDVIIIEFFILILSVIGNGIVVIAIIQERRLRTSLNYLVLNLSVCNILVVTTSIPFSIIMSQYNNEFVFGNIGCHILYPLATLSTNASVFTLLSITIDRYIAIAHPLKWRTTQKHTIKCIIGTYLYSFITVLPYSWNLEWKFDPIYGHKCDETWSIKTSEAYTILMFLLQYGLPLPVMIILYTHAWIKLKKQNDHTIRLSEEASMSARSMSLGENELQRTRLQYTRPSVISIYSQEMKGMILSSCFGCSLLNRKNSDESVNDPSYSVANGRRRQTIKTFIMFFIIIIIFTVCSLPNQIIWLCFVFFNNVNLSESLKTTFYILHYTNCVLNPLIYGGLNKYFWRGYKRVLFCALRDDGRSTFRSRLSTTVIETSIPLKKGTDLFNEGIITRNPVQFFNAGSVDSILDECGTPPEEDLFDESKCRRVKFKLSGEPFRKISIGKSDLQRQHRKISTALTTSRQRKLTLPVLSASSISPEQQQILRKHSMPSFTGKNESITFDDSFSVLPPTKSTSSLREKIAALTKSSRKRRSRFQVYRAISENSNLNDNSNEFYGDLQESKSSDRLDNSPNNNNCFGNLKRIKNTAIVFMEEVGKDSSESNDTTESNFSSVELKIECSIPQNNISLLEKEILEGDKHQVLSSSLEKLKELLEELDDIPIKSDNTRISLLEKEIIEGDKHQVLSSSLEKLKELLEELDDIPIKNDNTRISLLEKEIIEGDKHQVLSSSSEKLKELLEELDDIPIKNDNTRDNRRNSVIRSIENKPITDSWYIDPATDPMAQFDALITKLEINSIYENEGKRSGHSVNTNLDSQILPRSEKIQRKVYCVEDSTLKRLRHNSHNLLEKRQSKRYDFSEFDFTKESNI